MIRGDDSKPKNPFSAFLDGFAGNGQRPANAGARRPLFGGRQPSPPKPKRPCNCSGKRRAP